MKHEKLILECLRELLLDYTGIDKKYRINLCKEIDKVLNPQTQEKISEDLPQECVHEWVCGINNPMCVGKCVYMKCKICGVKKSLALRLKEGK